MKQLYILLIFLLTAPVYAQFQDDFSDEDFTSNPTWLGETERFSIENQELRLTAPEETGVSYLVTESQAIENAEWEFFVRMEFQPSGSNLARVYLISNQSNLKGAINGYFVQIGDTPREISLYRQDGTTTTEIISGVDGRVASNPVEVSVKVTRDQIGNWELFSDTLGGTDYFQEGTAFDETYTFGFYTGVYCDYTATRSDLFYFDDFQVTGDPFIDLTPPELMSAEALSSNEVEVVFNKIISEETANEVSNYSIDLGIGNPSSVQQDAEDLTKILLTFDNAFDIGTLYTLTTSNLQDLFGNFSGEETATIQYVVAQMPEFGDIIINEFLPNESPAIGLPEVEFVELYNRSDKYFHLDGWKLSDRTSTGTIQDEWLYPGEYLILVPTSGLEDYPSAINVTSWASLNNSGDEIVLATDSGFVVDSINYTDEWYRDEAKSVGGYSIERINPTLLCGGKENWIASQFLSGGTPGSQNSYYDTTPDTTPPSLIEVLALAEDTLQLTFDQGMDSLSLMQGNLTIDPTIGISSRLVAFTYPRELLLITSEPFVPNVEYQLTIEDIADCSGNTADVEGIFFLPDVADSGDLIINEILHNTLTGGSDFVEIYNRSEKFIDLLGWQLGNFDEEDTVSSLQSIEQNYLLPPDDYVVLTKDSSFQLMNYPFATPGKFIQMETLPTYTNDSSTVYLVFENQVMDKVSYTEEWHFQLLQSIKGVSLERFDADGPSNDANNWHSASETVGFATPGRVNSQVNSVSAEGMMTLSGSSFSPDNDGFEDVLLINYRLTDPEMVGKLVVYDDQGRKTKTLLQNHLLGMEGTIKWDGVRDDLTKASIGPYIIVFEALNANTGEQIALRKVVTLAGKL